MELVKHVSIDVQKQMAFSRPGNQRLLVYTPAPDSISVVKSTTMQAIMLKVRIVMMISTRDTFLQAEKNLGGEE